MQKMHNDNKHDMLQMETRMLHNIMQQIGDLLISAQYKELGDV